MRLKLAIGGLLVAACLAGCSSPPKLKVPTGDWEDFNPPISVSKVQPASKGGIDGQRK